MSKKSKGGFYAVYKGRNAGVFRTWDECEAQIKGFPGARYKKFNTESEARLFAYPNLAEGSQSMATSGQAPASSNTSAPTATGSTEDPKGKKRAFGTEVSNPEEWNVVYSDGACKGNGKQDPVAGVGVWWGPDDPRNLYERCPGLQTNNRAELIAILRVLETIPPEDTKPLIIRTDSQYSIQCFRDWIHSWKKKGWKNAAGQPVKNSGVIRCTSLLLDIRGALGHRVVFEYVKGHSGDPGNDGADWMANLGAALPEAPDRDWDALYVELTDRMRQIGSRRQNAPFEVKVSDDLVDAAPETEEPAAKVRKLNTDTQAKSGSATPAVAVSKGKQPAIPTKSTSSSQPAGSAQQSVPVPTSASAAMTQPPPRKSSHQQPTSQPSLQESNASVYDWIWNPENKEPLQAIFMAPAIAASVDANDVNFEDYADCILDADDLANELLSD
ncbi:hypothetical protein D9619_002783 [Psilocybe cf. subviscida]|uniref:ribonuclease H n=1 Tax=Psilocybe cf. subviscida TaxID=2480587 RepID=A0A8H5ETI7_9AGAR|nr:hypothetical protein D9619_002783 [Psilocybe cf. subviscida]